MELRDFISALPHAAASPYAFVAYVLLIAASIGIAWRVKRNKNLLDALEKIPSEQRAELLQHEMGTVLPNTGINAEQWLEHKIHQYYLLAFLSLIICGTVIFAIAYSNPKPPIKQKWNSSSALAELGTGISKEYARSILGKPPVSDDISERLRMPEKIIYERYSSNNAELQVLYMENKIVSYVIRLFDGAKLDKAIWTGSQEWLVGKSTFAEAGDDPQFSSNEFHWGKSICQVEQHYYGHPGDYNNFYYLLNTHNQDGQTPERSRVPDTLMVSEDICSFENDKEAEKECTETLLGMACTHADDFE